MAVTSRNVKVGGLRFHVVEEGAGAPVLLLHGFPDSSRLWRHQMTALAAAGFRAIAPDLRGFGDSDKPENVSAYELPVLLGDVVGLLDALELDRVQLVAHDWGAAVAWVATALLPERIDRLVAMSVGHPGSFANPTIEQREKSWYMLFFQFEGVAEEQLSRDDWALFRQWARQYPDLESAIRSLSRPGALRAGLNWYRANVNPRATTAADAVSLPSVTQPVLGLWSTGDAYLTERQMLDSTRFVTGSWRYERVEGAGHWLQLDQPERVSSLLLDFLRRG